MQTLKDFENEIRSAWDSDNRTKDEFETAAEACFELAKKNAIDFSAWLWNQDYFWHSETYLSKNGGEWITKDKLFDQWQHSQK